MVACERFMDVSYLFLAHVHTTVYKMLLKFTVKLIRSEIKIYHYFTRYHDMLHFIYLNKNFE